MHRDYKLCQEISAVVKSHPYLGIPSSKRHWLRNINSQPLQLPCEVEGDCLHQPRKIPRRVRLRGMRSTPEETQKVSLENPEKCAPKEQ